MTTDIENNADPKAATVPALMSLLGAISAVAIVVVVIAIIALLVRNPRGTAHRLAYMPFANVIESSSFDGPLPEGWQISGDLKLNASEGLRVAAEHSGGSGELTCSTVDTAKPTAIEAVITPPDVGRTEIHAYITYAPGQELTCRVRHDLVEVSLPSGDNSATESMRLGSPGGRRVVRIALQGKSTVVLLDGRVLFADDLKLDPISRHVKVGVRYVVPNAQVGAPSGVVHSLRLLQP